MRIEDVWRQLHEIVKYRVSASAHVVVWMDNEFIRVTVGGDEFEVVHEACQFVDQIKDQIDRHNLSTQKFYAAIEDVQQQSTRILLELSNRSFTIPREVSVIDGLKSTSPRTAHVRLDRQVERLANEVEWYFSYLDTTQGSADAYLDAIDRAIDVSLLMMTQVLQRVGPDNLRYTAAKAYYDVPGDKSRRTNFWARMSRFYQIICVRKDHLGDLSRDPDSLAAKFDALRDFWAPMNGGSEDDAVNEAISCRGPCLDEEHRPCFKHSVLLMN